MTQHVDIHHLLFDELLTLWKADISTLEKFRAFLISEPETDPVLQKPKDEWEVKPAPPMKGLSIYDAEELWVRAKEVKTHFDTLTDFDKLKESKMQEREWVSLGLAAKALKEGGWYLHVGTHVNSNLIAAWKATLSVNGHWFLERNVRRIKPAWRSTMMQDLFTVAGKDYMLCTGGFWDIENGRFVGI